MKNRKHISDMFNKNKHKTLKKYSKKHIKDVLEQTKKKGRGGDTELAHINPVESRILKSLGGSGSINPKTGLREYFFSGVRNFIRNPGKTIKKSFRNERAIKRTLADIAATAAAVYGGPVGGAIGGGVRAAVRKENPLIGALKGAGYGTAAPMAANLAGQGLSALGANSVGSTLQNYATNNMGSWMGNMAQVGQGVRGLGLPFTGAEKSLGMSDYVTGGSTLSSIGGGKEGKGAGVSAGDDTESYMQYLLAKEKKKDDMSFMDKLQSNSMDFLSKPKNLLALGTTGLTLYDRFNQPKPKTAAQEGKELKEKMLAQRLTPEEFAAQEQYELQVEQAKRRNARKKFLPEERIEIDPLYTRVSTPEERERTGRWLNYYNNPQFNGNPTRI
jgi:hypothetical protein